jgi:hypothetical protein
MALKIIGAGFGRTGTHSLKLALETLGFAPCYHMVEVFTHPGHSGQWEAIARGGKPDWDALLGGYKAGVDWPVCHFWRELAQAYPNAKIILTERDAEGWYRSIADTIFEFIGRGTADQTDPMRLAQASVADFVAFGVEQAFGNRIDKQHVIDVYRRHNETVKREAPKDRLLVYDVPQGWKPLCDFLGVAVPDVPFPKVNTTEEFRNRTAQRSGGH